MSTATLAAPPRFRGRMPLPRFLRTLRDSSVATYGEEMFEQAVVERRVLWQRYLIVNAPRGIEHVLLDNAGNYVKSRVARRLVEIGFTILATHNTARYFVAGGVPAVGVNKVKEGRPHCVDSIVNGQVAMVVNTTVSGGQAAQDSFSLRRTALMRDVPYFTTMAAARAAASAIAALRKGGLGVRSLQEYHS